MRGVQVTLTLILAASSTLSGGPPPLVLKARPGHGRGTIIVGEPAEVDVSLRVRLPPGPLRWTLLAEKQEKASGGIEWLAENVPRREFSISIILEHKEFALARYGDLASRGIEGGTSRSLVRDVRFDLLVRSSGGAIVARGTVIAKVTCLAVDPEPACDTDPSRAKDPTRKK